MENLKRKEKEEYIKKILEKEELVYIQIPDDSIETIYELFENSHIKNKEELTDMECFYYGVYYHHISKSYDLAKDYYLLAIEEDNSYAMVSLASLNRFILENEEEMHKYYCMAISKENAYGMAAYGAYWITKDKKKSLMYLNMALKYNNIVALNNLAYYYFYVEEDYSKMKQYAFQCLDENFYEVIPHVLNKYYSQFVYDYSFLDFCKYTKKAYHYLDRFNDESYLPKEYYETFCQLDLSTLTKTIQNKQKILKSTGLWPINYKTDYIRTYNIMIVISRSRYKCIFGKDLLLLFAGYLFI